MGYSIFLRCVVRLKPEYIQFIHHEYLLNYEVNPDEIIPEIYREVYSKWIELSIASEECNAFYNYTLEKDVFCFTLGKKVTRHHGNLEEDYKRFLKKILVPITSKIHICEIEHDDWGNQLVRYTDSEIRSASFE